MARVSSKVEACVEEGSLREPCRSTSDKCRQGQSTGDDCEDRMSKSQLLSTLLNVLIATGVLAQPYALRSAGGLLGIIIILAVALIMGFTGRLVGLSLELATARLDKQGVPKRSRDFAALAGAAFGTRGRVVIGCIFVLELWFMVEAFLIVAGINFHILFGLGVVLGITISLGVGFALLFAPLWLLSRISAVSVFSIGFSVLAMIASGVSLPGSQQQRPYMSFHAVAKPAGTYKALGLALFAFSGHPCLPAIYWKTQEPEKDFGITTAWAFGITGVVYALVALLGYHFFGDHIGQVFIENIGQDLSGAPIARLDFLRYIATAGVLLKVWGALPLYLGPVLSSLEEAVGVSSRRRSAPSRLAVMSILAAYCWLVAVHFADVVSLLSAFSGNLLVMLTSVIFPSLMYLRFKQRLNASLSGFGCFCSELVPVCATILFGIIFAIYGTYQNIQELISGTAPGM